MSINSTQSKIETKILFFDGVCHLCNFWIELLIKLDRRNQLQFASLQGETAKKFLNPESIQKLDSLVFLKNDSTYEKSTAVLLVVAELGGLWKLSKVFFVIPKFMRDALYHWIAKNRYRWFGQRDSCRIPNESERNKLLP